MQLLYVAVWGCVRMEYSFTCSPQANDSPYGCAHSHGPAKFYNETLVRVQLQARLVSGPSLAIGNSAYGLGGTAVPEPHRSSRTAGSRPHLYLRGPPRCRSSAGSSDIAESIVDN